MLTTSPNLKSGFDFGETFIHQANLDEPKGEIAVLLDKDGIFSGFEFFQGLNRDQQYIICLSIDHIDGGIEADVKGGAGGIV